MSSLKFKQIESTVEKSGFHFGRFNLSSIKPGLGVTIGNTLRRVLLADLKGTAITAVRIAGINHEFSFLPGVREDILEILLNLKQIIFKSTIQEPIFASFKVQGPKVVTASLIDLDPQITLINENQYIATILDDSILEVEFKIERGVGYRLNNSNQITNELNFLDVDAIFMPVRRVNYDVDSVPLPSGELEESLTIDIWTNNSISPEDALQESSKFIVNIFSNLIEGEIEEPVVSPVSKTEDVPIEELQLSVRAYNCLKRAQIHSVSDLLQYSPQDLNEIKNFGQKSADEVFEALKDKLGITLKNPKIY
jgi:DNA-directed RNA polymerase subunit alpha